MQTKIDLNKTAVSAPLTMLEVVQVSAPYIVADALLYRALTEAALWAREDHLSSIAEEVMEDYFIQAERNLDEWLDDMKSEGQPRLYSQQAKRDLLREALESGRAWWSNRTFPALGRDGVPPTADENINLEQAFIDALMDRDEEAIDALCIGPLA